MDVSIVHIVAKSTFNILECACVWVCVYVRMCVCVKTILGLSSASMVVAAAAALAEEDVAAQVICLQEGGCKLCRRPI